ncbi:MAG: c-type cytochrome [Chloroflexota bacterium]|nr:MAG: c-type cytochrome [Chloroflexota bacterium]
MRLYHWRLTMLLVAAVLLAGCQSVGDETDPAATDGVLTGIPSLSELAGTPPAEILPLPALHDSEIALGRELYAVHCAACHGPELQGEADWQVQNEDGSFRAPPHDASGHTWHHSDSLLLESIRLGGARLPDNIGGTSKMPAFGELLDEEQMTAILTYIKSTWPDDVRLIQWEQTVREP